MAKEKKEKIKAQPEGSSGAYIPALQSANERYDINTNAEKVHKRDWLIRIIAIVLAALLLLLGVGYACTAIINNAGRFTVSLVPNTYGVQLSETEDFANPTLNLYASAVEGMDNITKEWILNKNGELKDDPVYADFKDLDLVYGDHNGTNYLAYTFAIRNAGTEEDDEENSTLNYSYSLSVVSEYLDAGEAVRVMLYKNGEPTVYARPQKDTVNQLESFAADKVFQSDTVVVEEERSSFKVGEIDRYTVILWLEGNDPECVNDILGGELKLKMDFEVLGKTGG